MRSGDEVLFTGPRGSALVLTPGDPSAGGTNASSGSYFSPRIFSPPIAPGGAWTVTYKTAPYPFTVTDPQTSAHLIVPVPKVSTRIATGLTTPIA